MDKTAYTLSKDKLCFPDSEKINVFNLIEIDKMFVIEGDVTRKMFEELINGKSFSNITKSIVKDYDIELEVVSQDLESLITSLLTHKIIKKQTHAK